MSAATDKAKTTILLSGSLAKEFGRKHLLLLESGTSQEAFSALKHTLEGFDDFILEAARRGTRFAIFRNRENVGVDHLTLSGTTEIRIVPVIAGSKSGGVLQTVLGVVLIAAGLGREATAVLSTLLALVILGVMPAVVRMFDKDKDQTP